MSADNLITRVGLALWGDYWQMPMARALGVHRDTVQDWRQGKARPRQHIYGNLRQIAAERSEEISSVIAALDLQSADE